MARASATHHETLELLGGLGFPVNPEVAVARLARRGLRPLPPLAGAPPRPRLRDRRRGAEGRRAGPAARAGVHLQGAPVGHRLQVPARGAHHPAARHHGVDRPDRPGHAVRAARAGVRRRLHRRGRPPSTTRTRCGPRTSAPATSVIVRKAGDVIPEIVGPVLAERPEGLARVDVPHATARPCGHELVRPEGEADHRCVNLACPARVAGAIEHFASRGAMDIEGLGEQRVQLFCQLGLLRDVGDVYSLTAERPRGARGLRRAVDRQPPRRRRGVQGATAGQPAGGAQHPPPGRCRQRAARPPLRPPRPDRGRLGGGAGRGRRRSARSSPPRVHEWFADPANRAVVDKLRRAGVNLPDPAAPEVPQNLAGPLGRRHRHARGLHPRRGRGGHQGAGRQVARAACRKKTTAVVVGADPGASKLTKATDLGVPILDEAGFVELLETGEVPARALPPTTRSNRDHRGRRVRLRGRVHRLAVHGGARLARRAGARPRSRPARRVRSLRPGHRPPVAPARARRAGPGGGGRADQGGGRRARASRSTSSTSCRPWAAAAASAATWSTRPLELRAEGYRTALITNNVAEFADGWRTDAARSTSCSRSSSTPPRSACASPTPASTAWPSTSSGWPPERSVFLDDAAGQRGRGPRRGHARACWSTDDHTGALAELDALLADR